MRVYINESELPWNKTAGGSFFIFLYFPEISILLHHFPEMRKNILKDDVI